MNLVKKALQLLQRSALSFLLSLVITLVTIAVMIFIECKISG
jgi:hypothetical protein